MRRIALSVLLWAGVAGPVWSTDPPAPLRLLDDRGEKIEAPLEVCFQAELRADCVRLEPGEAFSPPARLRSVRVEGSDHGPVSVRSEDFERDEGGHLLLRVPRKALLQIDERPAEPLTVSVYDKRAASLDKPFLTVPGVGAQGIKVPAGDLLVSLSSGRRAPDLHLVSTQPASLARVKYQARKGWSLVVRCRGSKTRAPLATVVVSLESVQGYGIPNRAVGEKATGKDGLALFPGLVGRTVDAGVRHPEFLTQKVQSLSAAPGALAVRDVVLEEGGRIRARVTVNGQVREGAFCKFFDPRSPISPDRGDRKLQKLYEGRTDRKGICRTERLPAGSYMLIAALSEDQGALERAVVVENGSEIEEDLAFSELRVTGTVSRGDKPVSGLMILALRQNEDTGATLQVMSGQATSDEDGTYEITLWTSGFYTFLLSPSPEKPPVAEESFRLDGEEGSKIVDFSLESASIRGRVVDEEGRPLERAEVKLRWSAAGEWWARSDERGEFEFLLESGGTGEVMARKKGYRESPPTEVALAGEEELPPVVLTLSRDKLFRGKLSSTAGVPVAGAWIGAVRSVHGDEYIEFTSERTDSEGRFEVAPVPGRQNRLFASGPNCPLSFFDLIDGAGDLVLRCQGQPAVLDLTLMNAEGLPIPNVQVILRQGSFIVPTQILAHHLRFLGLRYTTDTSGRLVVPNLAPGDYDIFVANPVNEGMIEAGSRTGYLTSTRLSPLATTELRLTPGVRPPSP